MHAFRQVICRVNIMLKLVKNIIHSLYRFTYPSFCHQCNDLIEQDTLFCGPCALTLPTIASITLPLSKKASFSVHALSSYDGVLRKLILQKNNGRWRNFKALAHLTAEHIKIDNFNPECIIPVPLHWSRVLWRGYNQSSILANEYGKIWNVPVFDGLERSRKTSLQSTLDKEARTLNVKKAFEIKKKRMDLVQHYITNKHVVLVDDVMTTGATLTEIAQLIQRYQPAKITALVVCRVG